jgi:nucleotide-binding universal stress UspA family protein
MSAGTTQSNEDCIVVGVDGSPASKQALVWAAEMAKVTGSSLDAVAAWAMPAIFGRAIVPEDAEPGRAAQRMLEETVKETLGEGRPLDMGLVVTEGNPSEVLLSRSRNARMLVVGSRGHGGFAGLLLGSVSANCAAHAHGPVVVIHEDTAVTA